MFRLLSSKFCRFVRWFTWRRCLKIAVALLLLVVAGYEIENWRGRRAMATVRSRYAAAGISLNLQDYIPPRVAPKDNFCATPLLDGIALSRADDTVPGWQEAMDKRARLSFRINYPYNESSDPNAGIMQVPWDQILESLAKQTISNGPPRTRPKGAPFNIPRWNLPADAPPTAASVYTALDAEKAIFEELAAAAQRPKAVFTPLPCDYFPVWEDRDVYYAEAELKSLLRLRIAAAAETGRHEEAAALVRVLWRLREALVAEPAGGAYEVSVADLHVWTGAVLDVLACRPPAEVIRGLMVPLLSWDAEQEYMDGRKGGAAASAFVWQTLAEEARGTFRGELHRFFRPRGFYKSDDTDTVLRMPSGWLWQNGENHLQRQLDYHLLPFLNGGFSALPAAEAAFTAEAEKEMLLDRLVVRYPFWPRASPFICSTIQRTRLTMLVLAMELHRLAKGRYPDAPAALVTEFISAIPGDLDGAPLRATVTADGQQAVVYSVGWNQRDDWRGTPPEKIADTDKEADWILKLPVTRSARPAVIRNKSAQPRR